MHSTNFLRGVLVFSLAVLIALPSRGFADDAPDTKASLEVRTGEIVAELQKLSDELNAADSMKFSDEDAKNAYLKERNDKITTLVDELRSDKHKLNAAVKKYNKAVRDEAGVANQQKVIDDSLAELKKGVESGTISKDREEELQQKIQDAKGEQARLTARIARKEKQYRNKVGEDMPVRCTEAGEGRDEAMNRCRTCSVFETARDDGTTKTCVQKVCKDASQELNQITGECQAACVATEVHDSQTGKCVAKTAQDTRKRKIAACWDTSEAASTKKKIYSLFRMGESSVKLKTSENADIPVVNAEDPALTAYFQGQVSQADQALGDYGRVSKVVATSYTSKVPYVKSKQTDARLAKLRSQQSIQNLFAELSVDHSRTVGSDRDPRPADLDYASDVKEPSVKTVSVGPKWTLGEYERLVRKKVSPNDLLGAAKAILKNPDPSPVKATTGTSEERLTKTVAALKQCCALNQATLKYQPYQFTELTVTMPKFTPGACTLDSRKIAGSTSAKTVGETEVTDEESPAAALLKHSGSAK